MATESELKELQDLLADYDTALLTTRGEDGHFHSRPMALQARSVRDGLWFATWEDTEKVADLESDPHCCVTLYKGRHDSTYISISGNVELIRDKETIRQHWSPSWLPWFPKGPDEERVVLLKVNPEHAEYVHPTTGRLQVLFTMARRLVHRSHEMPAPKHEVDLHGG